MDVLWARVGLVLDIRFLWAKVSCFWTSSGQGGFRFGHPFPMAKVNRFWTSSGAAEVGLVLDILCAEVGRSPLV